MNWPPVPSSRSRVINPSDHLGQRPPWREQRLVSSFSVDKVNDLDYSIPLQRQRLAIVGRWNSLLQNREAQLSMTAEEILELFELGLLIPKLYRGLNEDHFFTPRTPAFSLVYTTVDLDLPSLFSVHELLDPHLKRRILPVNGTFLDLPSILEHYSYVLLQHGQYMTNPEPSSFHFRFYLFDKLDYIKDGFLLLFGRGSIDTPKARRVHPCLKNRTSLWPKTIQHYLENEATYTGCFATSAGQQIGEVATWGTVR